MDGLPRKRTTVLCIGNDPVALNLRGAFLREQGYCVLSSGDGYEGINLAAAEPVDAVVLDLGKDGSEASLVASEIKRLRPGIPTIYLTEERALKDGARELADVVVPKADGPDILVEALKRTLSGDCRSVVSAKR